MPQSLKQKKNVKPNKPQNKRSRTRRIRKVIVQRGGNFNAEEEAALIVHLRGLGFNNNEIEEKIKQMNQFAQVFVKNKLYYMLAILPHTKVGLNRYIIKNEEKFKDEVETDDEMYDEEDILDDEEEY